MALNLFIKLFFKLKTYVASEGAACFAISLSATAGGNNWINGWVWYKALDERSFSFSLS